LRSPNVVEVGAEDVPGAPERAAGGAHSRGAVAGCAHRRDRASWGSGHAGAPGRADRMDAGVGEEDEDTAGPPERGGSFVGAARAELEPTQRGHRRWGRAALWEEEERLSSCAAEGVRQKRI